MTDACEQCPLDAARAVASRGPVPARVLLLSGAPRHHEEREGVAFASPLFSWLEESLATAGIDPAGAHYATLIGCRPPHQRPLREAEIAACAPRLDLTIQAVEPRVIVLCGPDVVAALLPGVSLSHAHGILARRGRRHYYPIRHPYTVLHSEQYVAEVMDDLRRLAALLDEEWPAEPEEEQEPDARGVDSPKSRVESGSEQAVVPLESTLPLDTGIIAPPDAMSPTVVLESAPLATGDGRRATGDGQQETAQDDTRAEAVAIAVGGDAGVAGDTSDTVEDEDGPTQLSLF